MTTTTELVIVRHGEAVCNTLGIVGGQLGCTGLTDRGRDQADRVADRLGREHLNAPFKVVIVTPRRRVVETGDVVAARLGMPPVTIEDLRGPDHGTADGRAWTDVKTAFGGAAHTDPDRPYANGADSWSSYLARAQAALRHLLQTYEGQRVLIIGHGETSEAAHAMLMRFPTDASKHTRFWTDHTGITRWQRTSDRFGHTAWTLASHNDTRHLA
jgi:2,3-bisphosphoglycerate-dependent phosphoglycerate mutase